MNEQEANFEALGRLLALKRHEVPPPGYFNNFSTQVITQIRLGETAKDDGPFGRLFVEAPWLLKFIRVFEAKPAYAGAFASVLFLLLVAGIVYSNNPDVATETFVPAASASTSSSGSASLAAVNTGFLDQSMPQTSGLVSSTNPVLSLEPSSSPFGGQNPLLQPVGFTR
jgi:hypothetical protein